MHHEDQPASGPESAFSRRRFLESATLATGAATFSTLGEHRASAAEPGSRISAAPSRQKILGQPNTIKVIGTGLVYRNPDPQLRAVHTWHPSLAAFDSGELVASFDLGQGAESLDYATYTSRSRDFGATWDKPRRLLEEKSARRSTHSIRISRIGDELIGFGGRFYRDDSNKGLVNPDNLGYVPMDLFLMRSSDRGRTWQAPVTIRPPLVGPSFEICHRVIELSDGRWLAPTSTWKAWDGSAPSGMKAIALVSKDRGQTWNEYLTIMDAYDKGVIHWENSIAELPDKRLLAVAWAFEPATGKTLPTPYSLCSDEKTFSRPRPTGLSGQTAKILCLADGRVLCLYRRHDQPGLWACVAQIDGDNWKRLSHQVLWSGAISGMEGQRAPGVELSALKFGFPSMFQLSNGDVLAAFWCSEDCINNIRWIRLRIA